MIKTHYNWKVRLFRKSVVKKLKYKMLRKYSGEYGHLKCLDLGSDNGMISYLLRSDGGQWYSADIDKHTVKMIRDAVNENVYLIESNKLPFADKYFDLVVIVDLLEHIEEDAVFMLEVNRVLMPGGSLIINVPFIKNCSLTRRIRKVVGLVDEKHGHVRAGYSLQGLSQLVPGCIWEGGETYSRGFTELIDIVVSVFISGTNKKAITSKGLIVEEEDLLKYKKSFRLYSFFYPLLWFISKLDVLFYFMPGHRLITRFKKGENDFVTRG